MIKDACFSSMFMSFPKHLAKKWLMLETLQDKMNPWPLSSYQFEMHEGHPLDMY